MKLFIRGKGKFGYLTGANKAPKPEDLTQLLGKPTSFFLVPTAKDLWDAIQETYSDLGNAAQMFEIKTKLKDIKQGLNKELDEEKGVIVLGVTTVGNEATQEDRCWKIQGKPLARRNLRPDCNSKAYHSESKNLDNQTATSPFTKE
ncbi:hypothetical protein CK203_005803 [Vitis vinifera]|uniref:Uncharacterized protein n=1 Tax=Vitis vinifera TaxID=29760 RepID=A0A438K3R1_VITVI|nr:hypothetical protein CK203_005803 [Vitis vinifera]